MSRVINETTALQVWLREKMACQTDGTELLFQVTSRGSCDKAARRPRFV